MDYSHAPDDQKSTAEYAWLAKAMEESGGIRQGIFLATASGQLLDRVDGGWPIYDADITMKKLAAGLAKFNALPKAERSSANPIPEGERMTFDWKEFSPPKDALDLTVINRSLPYEGADKFDIRHPDYIKVDRLILSREDQLALLPASFEKGTVTQVPKQLCHRILLHNHLAVGCDAWWDEHIKHSAMQTSVETVTGNKATLQIQAEWKAKADSKWCKSSYDGKLLGRATVDITSRKLLSLELVALGTHDVGEMRDNMHRNVRVTPVGMVASITPPALENQPPPAHWPEYPKTWRK